MDDERTDEQRSREAGDKSEHLLDETYLSGGVGMGTAGPRLSASALNGGDDEDSRVVDDGSWKSHAVEEGGPSGAPVSGGGLRATLRRLFDR